MMRRAVAVLVVAAALLLADVSTEVFDVVASMAAALSDENPAAFASTLSTGIPNRDRLLDHVKAMIAQADVRSSLDRISEEGDDRKYTLVLDWTLALQRKGPDMQIETRHEAVTLTFVRDDRKWKVASISPESFFAPPNFR